MRSPHGVTGFALQPSRRLGVTCAMRPEQGGPHCHATGTSWILTPKNVREWARATKSKNMIAIFPKKYFDISSLIRYRNLKPIDSSAKFQQRQLNRQKLQRSLKTRTNDANDFISQMNHRGRDLQYLKGSVVRNSIYRYHASSALKCYRWHSKQPSKAIV